MTTDREAGHNALASERTPLRADAADLRAMKRALARAPLGPIATLALTHAILHLEDELARPRGLRG